MFPSSPLGRRPRPASHAANYHGPDSHQINYEDMFTAIVPESDSRKRFSKLRRSLIPGLCSGPEYLDQLMFNSRTQPLPPLSTPSMPDNPGTSVFRSWKGALHRWKHQLAPVDEHSEKTPGKPARYYDCRLEA